MEKTKDIRKALGFTQLDMAVLLGISRSHYTMHESGLRKLPLGAMQLLASLLSYYNSKKTVKRLNADAAAGVQEQRKLFLERLLKENDYQRLVLERKIETTKEKIQLAEKRPNLAKLLEKAAMKTGQYAMTRTIIAKALHKKDSGLALELLKLEIRQEALENEKMTLTSRLAKIETLPSLSTHARKITA